MTTGSWQRAGARWSATTTARASRAPPPTSSESASSRRSPLQTRLDRFQRVPESKYDCIVIGTGPGGYVAAIRATQLGMKTAVIEKDRIGGRCLNSASIPAKAVLRAADVLTEVQHGSDFGINVSGIEVDFSGVVNHRKQVVSKLTGGVGGLF